MTPSRIEKKPDLDTPWVTQAKAGDFEAFEHLVNRHEKRLYAFAMHILRNREDAEDAVQSTFVKALEHLQDFRETAAFGTWLTRIAGNTALTFLRKRKNNPISLDEATNENEEGFIPHPDFIADWSHDPTKKLEQDELQTILDRAIEALPEKHRLVFMLRDVVGMQINETAGMLGISEANVKVRLLRARLALRERLTRRFGDEEKRVIQTHAHAGKHTDKTSAELLLKSYQA